MHVDLATFQVYDSFSVWTTSAGDPRPMVAAGDQVIVYDPGSDTRFSRICQDLASAGLGSVWFSFQHQERRGCSPGRSSF